MGKQIEMLEAHADLAADPPQVGLARRDKRAVFLHMGQWLAVNPDSPAVNRFQRHQYP